MLPDMLRFIIDTQLPPLLSDFLNKRGFDSTHVVEYPLREFTPDAEVVSIAIKENRIVVSKDFDFFDHFLLKNYPPAILLLQVGNIKNRELFVFMENHMDVICKLFSENIERMILINQHKIVIY